MPHPEPIDALPQAETERRMQFGLRRALTTPAKPHAPSKGQRVESQSK